MATFTKKWLLTHEDFNDCRKAGGKAVPLTINKWQERLRELVDTNEELQGYRVVIDYAISLACEMVAKEDYADTRKKMEDYVEKLYEEKYDHKTTT